MKRGLVLALAMVLVVCALPVFAQKVTLTIESWRNDDLSIWTDQIIPVFEKQNPDIHVVFSPAAPAEYNGVLNTKLQGGTAGSSSPRAHSTRLSCSSRRTTWLI